MIFCRFLFVICITKQHHKISHCVSTDSADSFGYHPWWQELGRHTVLGSRIAQRRVQVTCVITGRLGDFFNVHQVLHQVFVVGRLRESINKWPVEILLCQCTPLSHVENMLVFGCTNKIIIIHFALFVKIHLTPWSFQWSIMWCTWCFKHWDNGTTK